MKHEKLEHLLQKAEIDLKTIENLIEHDDSPAESICFHAQQAVEKYLKAYLQFLEIKYNPSHDLDYLIRLIIIKDADFECFYDIAEELTPYAVVIRYENDTDEYSAEDALRAYKIAKQIKETIKQRLTV